MTTYKIRCHVCGREFDHEAHFIAGVPVDFATGRLLITCNVDPALVPQHAGIEIRDSYLRQMGGSAAYTELPG